MHTRVYGLGPEFKNAASCPPPPGQVQQAAAPLKPVYARLPSLQSLVVDVGAIPPGALSTAAEEVIMLPRVGPGAAAAGGGGGGGRGLGGVGGGGSSSSSREGEAVLMQLLLPALRGAAAPGQPGAQVGSGLGMFV